MIIADVIAKNYDLSEDNYKMYGDTNIKYDDSKKILRLEKKLMQCLSLN